MLILKLTEELLISLFRVHRDRLADVASSWLLANSNIQQAGKSSVIRQHCSAFVISTDFGEVRSAVEESFNKCKSAIEFFRSHRDDLSALLEDVTKLSAGIIS